MVNFKPTHKYQNIREEKKNPYNDVNDGSNGFDLGGSGVICSREVLPVVVVCGDDRQPGVLTSTNIYSFTPGTGDSRSRDCLSVSRLIKRSGIQLIASFRRFSEYLFMNVT